MTTTNPEVVEGAEDVAHAVEAGMPQLDFATFPNQIFWLVVTLIVIYLVLTRVALPRIGSILAERKGVITNDLAAAEELKQKAVDAERAYNEALAKARTEAAKIVAQAKAEIQAGLDAATAEADQQIQAKAKESEARIAEIRDGAADAVTAVARDTARELVIALGGQLDARAIAGAVNARLRGKA